MTLRFGISQPQNKACHVSDVSSILWLAKAGVVNLASHQGKVCQEVIPLRSAKRGPCRARSVVHTIYGGDRISS